MKKNPEFLLSHLCGIIQIQVSNEKLWPVHRIFLCVYRDFDLEDIILGQGYDTSLRHGQQLCEILSK